MKHNETVKREWLKIAETVKREWLKIAVRASFKFSSYKLQLSSSN